MRGSFAASLPGSPDFAEPVLGLAEGETRGLNPGYFLRFGALDELSDGRAGAVDVEIDVVAFLVGDEALRLVCQREQTLTEGEPDHVVARPVQDQERRLDRADPFVRMELVAHQPAHRHV